MLGAVINVGSGIARAIGEVFHVCVLGGGNKAVATVEVIGYGSAGILICKVIGIL